MERLGEDAKEVHKIAQQFCVIFIWSPVQAHLSFLGLQKLASFFFCYAKYFNDGKNIQGTIPTIQNIHSTYLHTRSRLTSARIMGETAATSVTWLEQMERSMTMATSLLYLSPFMVMNDLIWVGALK